MNDDISLGFPSPIIVVYEFSVVVLTDYLTNRLKQLLSKRYRYSVNTDTSQLVKIGLILYILSLVVATHGDKVLREKRLGLRR